MRVNSLAILLAIAAFVSPAHAAADPFDEIAALIPLWRSGAPLCEGAPSSESCHDGDMTLFSGLLCSSGEELGCQAVADAQGADGRWYRSPRLARHPELKPQNSFSWDMALGVQLYAVTKGDRPSLDRWLDWIETNRPCLVMSPKIDGKDVCLVRGWPRWCPDDTENGCMAKPQDLAMLGMTIKALGAHVPQPAVSPVPSGLPGFVLGKLIDQSREANAELSLGRLLEKARGLQPYSVLVDASVNREGFPRHLVGTSILLLRSLCRGGPEVDLAAAVLARRERDNPFFDWLDQGSTPAVADRLLALAPHTSAEFPSHRHDWAWQRAANQQAWKESNLWDFVFMGNILTPNQPDETTADLCSKEQFARINMDAALTRSAPH